MGGLSWIQATPKINNQRGTQNCGQRVSTCCDSNPGCPCCCQCQRDAGSSIEGRLIGGYNGSRGSTFCSSLTEIEDGSFWTQGNRSAAAENAKAKAFVTHSSCCYCQCCHLVRCQVVRQACLIVVDCGFVVLSLLILYVVFNVVCFCL